MSPFSLLSKGLLILDLTFVLCVQVDAQVIPDSTLGAENSIVSPSQANGVPTNTISGGAIRGTSLFHSFEQFSIPAGSTAYFNNALSIQNVIGRITGLSISNIDGLLQANGTANLYLLNPNGIVFGSNASLNIGGSFLATTADSIDLPNGTNFSATQPQALPLLTINLPVGLRFTGNPGRIDVQGQGHNLAQQPSPLLPQTSTGPIPTGLGVEPGHTLALVGGNITFTGGVVTAPSGRIEVGSVASGSVSINPKSLEGFKLDYGGVQSFQDILLTKLSLLNASGLENGNIQLFGGAVQLTDNSVAYIENQGSNELGAIEVNALESLSLIGTTQFTPNVPPGFFTFGRGLITQALSSGKGADVRISTRQLTVQDLGRIYLSSYGSGLGGNLDIDASDFVRILGNSPFDPFFPLGSIVSTGAAGKGRAGNVDLTTRQLFIEDGGQLSSVVFGNGTGGEVSILASESVNISGFNSSSLSPSLLSSITQGHGNGGNLFINTNQLTIQGGGRVDTSTLAFGNAGNLFINATDFLKVSGTIPGSINPSLIIASGNRTDPLLQGLLGLPPMPSGASGNATVNTGRLSIEDGAQLTVKNDGVGNAGNLQVNANFINLNNRGEITASTVQGEGGNIQLQVKNLLLMQNGSKITAAAGGLGTGGNINIDSDLLGTLQNSSITANAEQGIGGQVSINTQGLFALPNSSITATSALGPQFNGIVRINAPDTDLDRATALPLTSPNPPKVSSVCQGRAGVEPSQFVRAGSGGIPKRPSDLKESNPGWGRLMPQAKNLVPLAEHEDDLTPIQGWVIHPDGTMNFTTQPGVFYSSPVPSCSQTKTTVK